MKIKASVLEEQKSQLRFQMLDLIESRAKEVRIKMVGSGVCHTDIAHAKNEFNMKLNTPIVLGHEGAGIVESIGPGVTKVKVGDHVIISNPYCGVCDECMKGEQWYCEPGTDGSLHLSGLDYYGTTPFTRRGRPVHTLFQQSSFAEMIVVHENTVTKIDPDIDLKYAGPLSCGLRTGAGYVYNLLKPRPADWVCVTGAGPVGLGAMWMARAMGAKTIVLDINQSRLDMAKETGADVIINSDGMSEGEMYAAIRAAADGKGTHFLVETTGVESVIKASMKQMRGGGQCAECVVVGGISFDSYTNDCNDAHTITFGRMGNVANEIIIPVMLDLYRRGMFPFDKLITFYPFEHLQQAMDDSETGRVIKPVVLFD